MTPYILSILIALLGLVHGALWCILLANLGYLRRQTSGWVDSLPSVSICIPARNEAANLRRLLPSLAAQDYPNVEVIVWDDGSHDDTWDVLKSADNSRIKALKGNDPPSGWLGKVHALYQCTRQASGDYYLFLDADVELLELSALQKLVRRHVNSPTAVSSGLPRLRGYGLLLVSLVPQAILGGFPWSLVRRTRWTGLSALNGQCWMIDRDVYHTHEPHEAVKNEVLEDIMIGRYLKGRGHPPRLLDLQDLIAVHMYDSFGAAWRGFRKNAYLVLGGRPSRFLLFFLGFVLTWLVAPFLSLWFLASLYGLKLITDRATGMPLWITFLTPISYLLGLALQLDSAVHHWTDRVTWKGRAVPSSSGPSDP